MNENPNVIFTIKATNYAAHQIHTFPHNNRFYVPSETSLETTTFSRESTPLTFIGDGNDEDDAKTDDDKNRHDGDELCFTFDKRPRDIKQGYVFGSNPRTCDILLGSPIEGISSSHFRITFDNQGRLVLIDSSAHGTAVSYNGQATNEKRRNPASRKRDESLNKVVNKRDSSKDFTWILFPERSNKQIILGHNLEKVPRAQRLQFSVEVANPKIVSLKEQYIELKSAYLKEMRTTIPFGLSLDSQPTTAGLTRSHSPKHALQRPIWLDADLIGRGGFGTVYRTINVSTGDVYAAKTFISNENQRQWDREVAVLRKVSHDHIVKFVDYDTERAWPRLVTEYLPLGNLEQQHNIQKISGWECMTLLSQGLSALQYLHSQNIAHRDIKPENILVEHREATKFCIKLADFGLANDDSTLKTFCGTWLYAAPEIHMNAPYTTGVDIWSLGVIVYQYAHTLPKSSDPRPGSTRWHRRIIESLNDWNSDGLRDFLKFNMLEMDPRRRSTTWDCLEKSLKLYEALYPAQSEPVPGSPTEAMSSSFIYRALLGAGYGLRQPVSARQVHTVRAQEIAGGFEGPEDEVQDLDTRYSKRQRMEPPAEELPPVPENKDLNTQIQQDPNVNFQASGGSSDGSSGEDSDDTVTNQDIDGGTDQADLTGNECDWVQIPEGNFDLHYQVQRTFAETQGSNVNEPTFRHGSSLAVIRESFTQADQHSNKEFHSGFAVGSDVELWVDKTIKASPFSTAGVPQMSPWHSDEE